MFRLNKSVRSDASVDLNDVIKIKSALIGLGDYESDDKHFSPYPDQKLFNAVKDFQRKNNLRVDGVLNPDGETQEKIKSELAKDKNSQGAFSSFVKNYQNMREANTIGADKYFHCMANYEASKSGWLGRASAGFISNMREAGDLVKGTFSRGVIQSAQDVMEDQNVNMYGRSAASSDRFSSAKEACAIHRPEGLDEKY